MKNKEKNAIINNAAQVTLTFGNFKLTANYDGSPLKANMVVVPMLPDDPTYEGKVTNPECKVSLRAGYKSTPAILVAVDPDAKDANGKPLYNVEMARQQYNSWQNDVLGHFHNERETSLEFAIDEWDFERGTKSTTESIVVGMDNTINAFQRLCDEDPQCAYAASLLLFGHHGPDFDEKMKLSAKNAKKVIHKLEDLLPKMLLADYQIAEIKRHKTPNDDYYRQMLKENLDEILERLISYYNAYQ